MARVIFSALIDTIYGKLGGTIFQVSNGGHQMRTRVSPRNPATQFQQNRRAGFATDLTAYRSLSTANRNTWLAPQTGYSDGIIRFTTVQGFRRSAGLTQLSAFTGTAIMVQTQISIQVHTLGTLTVQLSNINNPTDADTYNIIYACKPLSSGITYISPAWLHPLVIVPPASSITAIDITSEYTARFRAPVTGDVIGVAVLRVNSVTGAYSLPYYDQDIMT